ncbi:putative esterase [Aspergillus homomorphus CBS 101889]|uniref:Putative esterase n=1 Tax=Aspergillus homomorphus (strain CBS 101889) TaxID=1450537 RepID=A0A395I9H4_ASPHC|nr:putative esterase [Aspergillus homomorphus CBS 101889]RAL14794.1 putative esterase [Aspergillus homomorphus CBS 101889]
MKLNLITSLLALAGGTNAHPKTTPRAPLFLLAGDSTTAKQSTGGGGWGNGFINTTLHHGATGINYGVNGRTTVSYRADGYWATVLSKVTASRNEANPYVTIQFGHNDQKPAANISITEYTSNLERFVTEVRAAGGNPILVTPLSRRGYDNSTGVPRVVENLAAQRAATIAAARATGATFIDLNEASTRYLNSIGPADAWTYNLNPEDQTHLNAQGSVVFGGLVALLIEGALPELKEEGFVGVEKKLEVALDERKYFWP